VNGVPPSVTSLGFGGKFANGAPASVTTGVGNSNGYWPIFGNCCDNLFWPAKPARSGHRHHRKDHSAKEAGMVEPVYVPYAVPYAAASDEAGDDDSAADADPQGSYPAPAPRDSARSSGVSVKPDQDGEADAPVDAQPATVLVFKDGHRSDVLNYAIVGNTLFDFDGGRTRKILLPELDLAATQKANDALGVDFEIPDSSGR